MNKGYAYDEKVIKNENVTDKEYAYISENNHQYNGFNTKLEWERKYLYENVMKGLFGTVLDTATLTLNTKEATPSKMPSIRPIAPRIMAG